MLKKDTMKSSAIRVLATLALAAVPGFASPIYVSNFSFESPVAGLGGCGTNCLSGNVAIIPSWTASVAGHSGIFDVTGAGTYWNDVGVQAADGPQSAYVYTGSSTSPDTLSQTVAPLAVAGWMYTLQVDIGQRLDKPGYIGTADLLIGSTQHFVTCGTALSGGFVDCTTSYMATAADNGQAITVELSANALQGNFDNVRLDAVPEPASFFLIGSALFVLSSLRRRRANS
jgi:hypothetical protein